MGDKCIRGFKNSEDPEFLLMKQAYESCKAANVEVPDRVWDYFGREDPHKRGIAVELEHHECCSDYNAEMEDGYEIDISKLPKGVTTIRFYMSYQTFNKGIV